MIYLMKSFQLIFQLMSTDGAKIYHAKIIENDIDAVIMPVSAKHKKTASFWFPLNAEMIISLRHFYIYRNSI